MKQETLAKGAEITKEIAAQVQRLSELNNLIKDKRGSRISFESTNARVYIHDDRIIDIIIAILQADFRDKLQKAEQKFADLKD